MSNGYYILLQYCPDRARGETANVGVMLIDPDAGSSAFRISTKLQHAKRAFGSDTIDPARVRLAAEMFAHRLLTALRAASWDMGAVERFARREANNITLAGPRAFSFEHQADALTALMTDLVDHHQPRRARRPRTVKEVHELAKRLVEDDIPIFTPEEVRPHAATKIRPDFVWLNGQVNVVKGQVFSGLTNVAEPCAMLRLNAELLRAEEINIPEVGAGPRRAQLTVVGQFDSVEQETTIRELLGGDTKLLNVGDLPAMEADIRSSAHKPERRA